MILGAHESIAGGFHKAIERGKQATCDTIQMFNKSNSQWRAASKSDDVDKYFALIEETGVTVATSHSSYLINIGSPKPDLEKKSRGSLQLEMERCHLLKIPNLVMHPGSHVGEGEESGMNRIAGNINILFDNLDADNSVSLLLECTAGQGTNLGYTFEQIAYLIDKIDNKDKVGVCMDTCHIFAAGYPLSDPKEYKKTIDQFDKTISLEKLKIIHMNDSKKEFGSKRDRHEHIGKGFIGLEAFRNIMNDSKLADIPMILETPKGDDLAEDIENLKLLRSLVKS